MVKASTAPFVVAYANSPGIGPDVGAPDFLINNATYSTNNDYSNLTAEELDRHYKVNIGATTLLSSEFAKRFKKKVGGRIPIFTL
ncbi:SDR family NAD(P)-dependent oxidoreductase [Acinetobacter soli]